MILYELYFKGQLIYRIGFEKSLHVCFLYTQYWISCSASKIVLYSQTKERLAAAAWSMNVRLDDYINLLTRRPCEDDEKYLAASVTDSVRVTMLLFPSIVYTAIYRQV